jgi:hypothetical protein
MPRRRLAVLMILGLGFMLGSLIPPLGEVPSLQPVQAGSESSADDGEPGPQENPPLRRSWKRP